MKQTTAGVCIIYIVCVSACMCVLACSRVCRSRCPLMRVLSLRLCLRGTQSIGWKATADSSPGWETGSYPEGSPAL